MSPWRLPRRSNCPDAAILSYTFILLFTGGKKQVLKITRKAIFAVAQSGQITAQVGWRISAVLRGGRESVNGAEQKCFYKHERLRTCWPSQEWFTSVVPKEKQPQLTLFSFFFFWAKSQTPTVSNKKNNDCQTAESEGLYCMASCRCDPVTRLYSYKIVQLVQGYAGLLSM